MTNYRHFFRCFDCLAVMAVNPADYDEVRKSAVCSCGGELSEMGAVTHKTVVTSQSPCDYRCTNAHGPECDCPCRGANHGSGAVVKVVRSESQAPRLESPSAGRAMEFHLAQDAAIEAFESTYPGARAKFKAGIYIPQRAVWDACRTFKDAFLSASDLKTHSTRIERLTKLAESYKASTPTRKVVQPVVAAAVVDFAEPDGEVRKEVYGFAEPDIGGPGSAIDTARKWADQQRAIFEAFADPDGGHLVVEALAGTGKTTTIMEALKYSKLRDKCYTAFNKRNAEEAKQKIGIHGDVMTLNGLGYRYVRAQWPQAKPDDAVEIDRIKAALESVEFEALKDEKGTHSAAPRPLIKKLIGLAKNTFTTAEPAIGDLARLAVQHQLIPEKRAKELGWDVDDIARVVASTMSASTRPDAKSRISYNDQIWLPVVMGWVRPRFDLVVVDEAQDMSTTQLALARGSVRVDGRVVIVGDRRQAIYGFRGADSSGMARMQRELNAAVLPLTTTYRCPRTVVELAQKLVPAYNAAPSAPEGSVSEDHDLDGVLASLRPGDAFISRVNAPLMPACLKLIRRGVRAHVEGRDVGQQIADLVERLGPCSVAQLLLRLNTWRDERVAALQGDEETVAKGAEAITDTLETVVALTDGLSTSGDVITRVQSIFSDKGGDGSDVTFSSIHRAKGLEWHRVHVLASTLKTSWSTDEVEENNLAYVAITRAKRDLVMVYDR